MISYSKKLDKMFLLIVLWSYKGCTKNKNRKDCMSSVTKVKLDLKHAQIDSANSADPVDLVPNSNNDEIVVPNTASEIVPDTGHNTNLGGGVAFFLPISIIIIAITLGFLSWKIYNLFLRRGSDTFKIRRIRSTMVIPIVLSVSVLSIGFLYRAWGSNITLASDAELDVNSTAMVEMNLEVSSEAKTVTAIGKITIQEPTSNGYKIYATAHNAQKDLIINDEISHTKVSPINGNRMTDNAWGYSLNGGSNWLAIKESEVLVKTVEGATEVGDETIVTYGVNANNQLDEGVYEGYISYKAVAIPVPAAEYSLNLGGDVNDITVSRISSPIGGASAGALMDGDTIYENDVLRISTIADGTGYMPLLKVNNNNITSGDLYTVVGDTMIEAVNDAIYFLNTIDSDAIIVRSNGKFGLVDYGWQGTSDSHKTSPEPANFAGFIENVLNGKKFDFIIGTHAHGDHIGGFKYADTGDILNFSDNNTKYYYRDCSLVSQNGGDRERCEEVEGRLGSNGIQLKGLKTKSDLDDMKTTIGSFGNFRLDFYNIALDGDNIIDQSVRNGYVGVHENYNSIGILLTNSGKKAFLASDLEKPQEEEIYASIGKIDVLKAPHHGARTSSSYDFITTLNPSIVVVTSDPDNETRNYAPYMWLQQQGATVHYNGSISSFQNKAAIVQFEDGSLKKRGTFDQTTGFSLFNQDKKYTYQRGSCSSNSTGKGWTGWCYQNPNYDDDTNPNGSKYYNEKWVYVGTNGLLTGSHTLNSLSGNSGSYTFDDTGVLTGGNPL